MKRHYRRLLAALLFGAVLPQVHARATCDKIPVVPARVRMIAGDMLVNGLRSTLSEQTFAASYQEVVQAFRAFWTMAQVPARERTVGTMTMLSALDRDCFYLLQLHRGMPGSQVSGMFSVTKLRTGDANHGTPVIRVPLPERGRTAFDVESRDPTLTGHTWVMTMPGGARANAVRYRATLIEQGWREIAETPAYALDGTRAVRGHALALQRGDERLDAVFSDAKRASSNAVVNVARSR